MLYVKHPAGTRAQPYEKQRNASLECAGSSKHLLSVSILSPYPFHIHERLSDLEFQNSQLHKYQKCRACPATPHPVRESEREERGVRREERQIDRLAMQASPLNGYNGMVSMECDGMMKLCHESHIFLTHTISSSLTVSAIYELRPSGFSP